MKKSIAAIRTMKAMEEIEERLNTIETKQQQIVDMLLDTMPKAKREKYMQSEPFEILGSDDGFVKFNDVKQENEIEGA